MACRVLVLGAAFAAVMASASPPPAQAAFIATMKEVAGGVIMTGAGSIKLDGLTPLGPDRNTGLILPKFSVVSFAPPTGGDTDSYIGINPPPPFGPGDATLASSLIGKIIVFDTTSHFFVERGYASGDPLAATETFDGATFASLGVTPGTYVWTWGAGDTADTFTLQIVPEPATALLLGLPVGAIMLSRRRLRASQAEQAADNGRTRPVVPPPVG